MSRLVLRCAVLAVIIVGASRAHAARTDDPPEITLSDPMLVSPPPAPRTIASWDEAIAQVRAHTPDYLSGAQGIRRAEAQREIALAAVLPTLSGQVGYTHQFLTSVLPGLAVTAPAENNVAVSATISWSVINPRGIYGVGTANRQIEATQLTFEDQRRRIATALVDAMLATRTALRVAELNRTGLRAALERLTLTRARLAYGQAPEVDIDRASQDVAAARQTLIHGDESLRQAREALGVLLGSSVAVAPPDAMDLMTFVGAVSRTCRVNDDVERRPDVLAARKRLEIAQRGVTDAALMFAPTVTLSSTLENDTNPLLGPNTTWSAMALLTVPIYDGGGRYGTLRDRRAAIEQARQDLEQTRLLAIVASAQAMRAVVVAEQSRATALEQRDIAARVDQRTRDGYSKGLGTSLDLVISGQALRQAEINLAISDFQLEDARADAVLVNAECAY